MQTVLDQHVLDDGLFPELERAPGVYGVELMLLKPDQDARVPVPASSRLALLVSYTLLEAAVPRGSRWQLRADGVQPDGQPRQVTMHLAPAPGKRDNMQPIVPDPPVAPAPGMIDRRVFWVDLGPLIAARTLMPRDRLTLTYGTAGAQIALP